jgi:hypothetical protein
MNNKEGGTFWGDKGTKGDNKWSGLKLKIFGGYPRVAVVSV